MKSTIFWLAKSLFYLAYCGLIATMLFRRGFPRNPGNRTIRHMIGMSGLFIATISAILYLYFFLHIWLTGELLAHGSHLWIYYYAGEILALAGFLCGLVSPAGIRSPLLVIAITMAFQWYARMLGRVGTSRVIDLVMYFSVFLILLVSWSTGRKMRSPELTTNSKPN